MYSIQQDSFPNAPGSEDVNTYGFVVEVASSPNTEAYYSPSLSAYETAPETPICSPLFFSPTSGFLELPQTPRINGADALASQFASHLQGLPGPRRLTIENPADATSVIDPPPAEIMLFQPDDRPVYNTPAGSIRPTFKPVHPFVDSAGKFLFTTGDEGRLAYESLRKVQSEIYFIEDETRRFIPPGMPYNLRSPDGLSDNDTPGVQPNSEPVKVDSLQGSTK
ncbi:hypothetical protein HYPSUDRAFT_70169 [Hypholoma sublateritium FD-334 SS-4]|uniref:Uncharacterized protein n=1 Tax=Hypholoma sublateritium (strain FD-334 SS-4) TaxID=945553 RepID=A0A0D2M4Q3_HYPSF|nr:hypothetical protein HYPSUDRAFT_70169 [Hypholoma sublateritium FD-334 SS-4]